MDKALKDRLIYLADTYETEAFLEKDPSRFMHRYADREDQTVAAFIAAALAFGRREQILSHVEHILALAGNSPADWIAGGGWEASFPESRQSFYRMYTYSAMRSLFTSLREIERQGTMEAYFKKKYEAANLEGKRGAGTLKAAGGATAGGQGADGGGTTGTGGGKLDGCGRLAAHGGQDKGARQTPHLCQVIARCFPDGCTPVPHSDGCAFKKLNMFLRWMVREPSPVDLGLWASWYGRADLLMPLDTHVMQEATRLGLLAPSAGGKARTASFKCALELTDRMAEAFPGDPVRGDYALFGLGVDGGSGNSPLPLI